MSVRRFWPIAAFLGGVCLNTVNVGTARAQGTLEPRPILTASTLRRACVKVVVDGTSSHELWKLCNLPAPDDSNLQVWNSLVPADLPSPEAIRQVADELDDATWESAMGAVQQFERPLIQGGPFAGLGIGGFPDQSAVIWGITRFVVERGQEQLNETVILHVTKRVCSDADLGAFLSTSCRLLGKGEVVTPVGMPGAAALRDALRMDLVRLPGTAITRSLVAQKTTLDAPTTDAALTARYVAYFIAGLLNELDPVASLAHLAQIPPAPAQHIVLSEKTTPATAHLYLAALLAAAMEYDSVSWSQRWPATGLRRFYGVKTLLVNGAHKRPFAPPTPESAGSACIVTGCARIARLAEVGGAVELRLMDVRKWRDSLSTATSEEARRKYTFNTLSTSIGSIRLALDMGGDQPSYTRVRTALSGIERITLSLATSDYAGSTVRTIALVDTLGLTRRFPTEAVRVLTLASDIAQAEDAQTVDAALKSFAAPEGSYLRKGAATTGWYMGLNAYAGAAGGREGACERFKACDTSAEFVGAYVPVGVELGHSLANTFLAPLFRSIGLYAQAIDVGTLASWQVSQPDSVSSDPTIGFRQVFSPGLHLVLGIRNFPLAFGFGRSIAPNLRKIQVNGEAVERNAVRPLSIFAAMDVPIFP